MIPFPVFYRIGVTAAGMSLQDWTAIKLGP